MKRQHEPLRIPSRWVGQDRSFVVQLERLLDYIYNHMDNSDAWKTIYPVGAVFMSVEDKTPTELFGGTWEEIENSLGVNMWKRVE